MKNIRYKSLLASFLLLVFSINMGSVHAEAPMVSISSNQVKPAQETDVTVKISNNTGFASFKMNVAFDNSKLQPLSVAKGYALYTGTLTSNIDSETKSSNLNCVTAYFVNPTDIVGNGDLFVIKFRALDGASGVTPLAMSFSEDDIINQDFSSLHATHIDGTVEIIEDSAKDVLPSESPIPTWTPMPFPTPTCSSSGQNPDSGGRTKPVTSNQTPSSSPLASTSCNPVIILTPSPQPASTQKSNFSDLAQYSWAQNEIYYLAEHGIIKGTGKDTFAPEKNISRGDFALLLTRMLGIKGDSKASFDDVYPQDYYFNEICAAKEHGLISGIGNNLFDPTNTISRQDMFTITYRALKIQLSVMQTDDNTLLSLYTDSNSILPYAKDATAQLIKLGLVHGNNQQLTPMKNATRAETAVFIYRLFMFINENK